MKRFYFCLACEYYHPEALECPWIGRNTDSFTLSQLTRLFGADGWEDISDVTEPEES